MLCAFNVLNAKWNEEVVEYLASKFNTNNPRITVLHETLFTNATLAKFDDVTFIINAACGYLELSFQRSDAQKMEHIIQEILKWDAFTKHSSRFYVMVNKELSRSIIFDNGRYQGPNGYKQFFHRYEIEIFKI